MHTYEVVTTKAIAEEMARYDEAEFEELEFIALGRIKPITDELEAIHVVTTRYGEDSLDSMLHYRYRFTSEYLPSKKRWASFGVRVE